MPSQIPLHALTPRHSLMNIPVDTSDDDTLHALTQPIVSEKFLPEVRFILCRSFVLLTTYDSSLYMGP